MGSGRYWGWGLIVDWEFWGEESMGRFYYFRAKEKVNSK